MSYGEDEETPLILNSWSLSGTTATSVAVVA